MVDVRRVSVFRGRSPLRELRTSPYRSVQSAHDTKPYERVVPPGVFAQSSRYTSPGRRPRDSQVCYALVLSGGCGRKREVGVSCNNWWGLGEGSVGGELSKLVGGSPTKQVGNGSLPHVPPSLSSESIHRFICKTWTVLSKKQSFRFIQRSFSSVDLFNENTISSYIKAFNHTVMTERKLQLFVGNTPGVHTTTFIFQSSKGDVHCCSVSLWD